MDKEKYTELLEAAKDIAMRVSRVQYDSGGDRLWIYHIWTNRSAGESPMLRLKRAILDIEPKKEPDKAKE